MNKSFFKVLSLSFLGFLAIFLCGAAAQTYSKQNVRFPRVQIETSFSGGTANATAVKVEAFAENVLVNDALAADVKGAGRDWTPLVFDMLDPAIKDTPINGVSGRTYQQLAADLRTAVITRANAAGIQ